MIKRLLSLATITVLLLSIISCTTKQGVDESANLWSPPSEGDVDNPLLIGSEDEDDDYVGPPLEPAAPPLGGGSQGPGVSQTPPPPVELLRILNDKLDVGYQTKPYSVKLRGEGGSGDYEWSADGLPANGLKLEGPRIVGTPELFGDFPIEITLTDKENDKTVRKDFVLSVRQFVKEGLRIQVDKFSNGQWVYVPDLEEKVTIDDKARRLRLRVVTDVGGVPHAPRYHWTVKSPQNKLGVFAPPTLDKGAQSPFQIPEAQTVYLMAWEERGTGGTAQLDVTESGVGLDGTIVAVTDDFGNKHSIRFESLEVQKQKWQECKGADAPTITLIKKPHLNKLPLEKVLDQEAFRIKAKATGGSGPYIWEFSKPRIAEYIPFPNHVKEFGSGDRKEWLWRAVSKIDPDDPEHSEFELMFSVWPIVSDPTKDPIAKLDMTVTDSCGRVTTESIPLIVDCPRETLGALEFGLYVTDYDNYDSNRDPYNTWVRFGFGTGSKAAYWRLPLFSDNGAMCMEHAHWSGDTNLGLNAVKQITVETYDSCRKKPTCQSLKFDFTSAYLNSHYYVAFFNDSSNVIKEQENQTRDIIQYMDFYDQDEPSKIWMRRGDIFSWVAWTHKGVEDAAGGAVTDVE